MAYLTQLQSLPAYLNLSIDCWKKKRFLIDTDTDAATNKFQSTQGLQFIMHWVSNKLLLTSYTLSLALHT